MEKKQITCLAELVEKLRESKDNGCYAVLQSLIDKANEIKEKYSGNQLEFLSALNRIGEIHYEISGFCYGVRGADFINDKELSLLTAECIETFKLDL